MSSPPAKFNSTKMYLKYAGNEAPEGLADTSVAMTPAFDALIVAHFDGKLTSAVDFGPAKVRMCFGSDVGTKSIPYWPGTVETTAESGPEAMEADVGFFEVLMLGGVGETSGKSSKSPFSCCRPCGRRRSHTTPEGSSRR